MDVSTLFDSLLMPESLAEKTRFLSVSAIKFKNILACFKETALSFCFHCDTSQKTTTFGQIRFFLNDTPVFSFDPSDWNFQPNTDHIFWIAYWDIFKKEIYDKLYAYPRAVAKGEISTGVEREVMKLPEEETVMLYLGMAPNPQAIIEIYGLMYPDEPFYQQLKEEAVQGGGELELVFKLYTFEANNGNNDFELNHLTDFAGFLPTKFAYMNPEQFLNAEFIELMHSDSGRVDYFHPEQLMVLVASHVKSFLESFSYLGPLRKRPERFYVKEDASKNSANGEDNNIAHLLAYDDDLVRRVNEELAHLQTEYQIKIVHLTDPDGMVSGVFLLKLINQKTGVEASIKDVGFGFSQILPVIVRCITSSYRNVIIEQPELHLHPALQSELGDMFIRGNTKRVYSQAEYEEMLTNLSCSDSEYPNSWRNRHNRFFIETHSEHLILRLLRRVRETTEEELPDNVPPLTPDDIAVLYVQPGNNGAQVIHIPVTEDGEFATPWPGGFFAERARELF